MNELYRIDHLDCKRLVGHRYNFWSDKNLQIIALSYVLQTFTSLRQILLVFVANILVLHLEYLFCTKKRFIARLISLVIDTLKISLWWIRTFLTSKEVLCVLLWNGHFTSSFCKSVVTPLSQSKIFMAQ